MMEWWQQNDCPLCGASNCWCDCLEQLQAFNDRSARHVKLVDRETQPSRWQRFVRWLKGT